MDVRLRLATATLALVCASPSHAALPESRTGVIQQIYVDPNDIVLVLSVAGPCGSPLYHIQRSSMNFKELYAAMLAAFATTRVVGLSITACSNDRNIVSHGYVLAQ